MPSSLFLYANRPMTRKFLWFLSVLGCATAAYCALIGWQLSSALKAMVTVGGPFTQVTPQTRDPLTLDFDGNPHTAFGWPFETLMLASELGPLPAWVVPPEGQGNDTWMVYTHGIGGRRENGYRFLNVARPLGITTLLYAYRNDAGAPRSPDGIYHFGLTEWRDLEAAVQLARQRGARRIILAADSMGGAITGQYLQRATHTNDIVAAVLDAPALDLHQTLEHFVRAKQLPLSGAVTWTATYITPRRVGVDLAQTRLLPVLAQQPPALFLAHGDQDELVPVTISDQLAQLRPDATYLRTQAPHVESWSENPQRYQQALTEFLRQHGLAPQALQ